VARFIVALVLVVEDLTDNGHKTTQHPTAIFAKVPICDQPRRLERR